MTRTVFNDNLTKHRKLVDALVAVLEWGANEFRRIRAGGRT